MKEIHQRFYASIFQSILRQHIQVPSYKGEGQG